MHRALVLASFTVLWLTTTPSAAAQDAQSGPPSPEAQKCTALVNLDLEAAAGGPALITSAQLMDVPANGLERPFYSPSGYGKTAGAIATSIHQYCDVTGYVAPQNKFELKLPLAGEWNQNFFCLDGSQSSRD